MPNLHDPLLTLYDVPAYHRFYYHRAHLWYFSAKALTAVMAKAGFMGEVVFSQDYNLVNHLHWAFRDRPQATADEGLGPARLPLRDGVAGELRRDLDALLADTDRRYKRILARHRAGENLAFIGRKA
ncbi:MAG: hypothetical protein QF578_18720 [Alphaproteobacteria bacterium]|nr:hypothetical protein [Alphaproteobacteria bacterium]MDP6566869.1 hypothetical protein [Alphaproteobacteria bacterium]